MRAKKERAKFGKSSLSFCHCNLFSAIFFYFRRIIAILDLVTMAAPLIISSIEFLNNPAMWKDKFRVEITFEAHEELPKDIEWQLIYVASAKDDEDQLLDTAVVGPTKVGRHKFVLEVRVSLLYI